MGGGCAVASWQLAGGFSVVSWPSAVTMGGGSAATSSRSSMAGTMAGGSTFVSYITGRAPTNSDGDLRLALVPVEVPAKDSGGSLGPPLSYQLNRSAGLSAVGRWPAACLL